MAVSLTCADKMSWTPCDAGLTEFSPSSVVLTPDPPVIGSPATFVISGDIGELTDLSRMAWDSFPLRRHPRWHLVCWPPPCDACTTDSLERT